MAFMIIILHCNRKNCFHTYSRHDFEVITLCWGTICDSIFLQYPSDKQVSLLGYGIIDNNPFLYSNIYLIYVLSTILSSAYILDKDSFL